VKSMHFSSADVQSISAGPLLPGRSDIAQKEILLRLDEIAKTKSDSTSERETFNG